MRAEGLERIGIRVGSFRELGSLLWALGRGTLSPPSGGERGRGKANTTRSF